MCIRDSFVAGLEPIANAKALPAEQIVAQHDAKVLRDCFNAWINADKPMQFSDWVLFRADELEDNHAG